MPIRFKLSLLFLGLWLASAPIEAQRDPIRLDSVTLAGDKDAVARYAMKLARQRMLSQRQINSTWKATTWTKSVVKNPKMNLLELQSETWVRNGQVRDVILAYDDHRARPGVGIGNELSINASLELAGPREDIQQFADQARSAASATHPVETFGDMPFDLTQPTINLKRWFNQPMPGPLSIDANLYYRFTLNRFIKDSIPGHVIYEVDMKPRRQLTPTLIGTVWVLSGTGQILGSELTFPSKMLQGMTSLHVMQVMDTLANGLDVPRSQVIKFSKLLDDPDKFGGVVDIQFSDYVINPVWEISNLAMKTYAEGALEKTDAEWAALRPYSLAPEEVKHLSVQDSLILFRDSDEYRDSLDRRYNEFKWYKPLLTGYGHRNHRKGYGIELSPLISSPRFVGVGGFRFVQGVSGYFRFKDQTVLSYRGEINLRMNAPDAKGRLSLDYLYDPSTFRSVKVGFGDEYMLMNTYGSMMEIFSRGNFARRQFVSGSWKGEIANGLRLLTQFDFSHRLPIEDTSDLMLWNLYPDLDVAQEFEPYTVALFKMDVVWTPFQPYIMKGRRKVLLNSKWPTMRGRLIWGIPDLFGSDVDYRQLEFTAIHDVVLPRLGYGYYRAGMGSFFTDDYDKIKLIEHRYFRGSDYWLFSDPLSSLQALEGSYHTPKPYVEAYGIHHFEGKLLQWIPGINRLKLETAIGAGGVWIQEEQFGQVETFVGLERRFKLFDESMKWGVYYVSRPGENLPPGFRFKFGLNTYNAYAGQWMF